MNDAVLPELLSCDEPAAFTVERPQGRSPFLLLCDHAGNRIPRRLRDLGLAAPELQRHIAWDIGIAGVGRELAARLDAVCIAQPYSRLVIDCNRPPEAADSIVGSSDGTPIPGNANLDSAQRLQRQRGIFQPYHRRIEAELDGRTQPPCLIALHSFTPVFAGFARPWHVGVLYQRDARLAAALLGLLRGEGDLEVGDNQPYTVGDDTDYAIPRYGEARGLLHVELELRQDLIADAQGQQRWAARLARLLQQALQRVRSASGLLQDTASSQRHAGV